jgi:hypothetical protein
MDTEKQKKLLEIFTKGKYDVNTYTGDLLYYRSGKAKWEILKPVIMNGYKQYAFYPGRYKGDRVTCLGQYAIWLFKNGSFDPDYTIGHSDGNHLNNSLSNLILIESKHMKATNTIAWLDKAG